MLNPHISESFTHTNVITKNGSWVRLWTWSGWSCAELCISVVPIKFYEKTEAQFNEAETLLDNGSRRQRFSDYNLLMFRLQLTRVTILFWLNVYVYQCIEMPGTVKKTSNKKISLTLSWVIIICCYKWVNKSVDVLAKANTTKSSSPLQGYTGNEHHFKEEKLIFLAANGSHVVEYSQEADLATQFHMTCS